MYCHAEGQTNDRILRHPTYASQWRNVDRKYSWFGDEPRNIRLGMSTDEINIFSNTSNIHSTCLVLVYIYNLPLWLCMKQKHLFMLSQGTKQPRNGMKVYMQPMYEKIDTLEGMGGVRRIQRRGVLDTRIVVHMYR